MWVNVSSGPGYWEIEIEDFTLGVEKLNVCKGCRVAMDTGTSQLAGPSSMIAELRRFSRDLPVHACDFVAQKLTLISTLPMLTDNENGP